jgi:hypothetical protein
MNSLLFLPKTFGATPTSKREEDVGTIIRTTVLADGRVMRHVRATSLDGTHRTGALEHERDVYGEIHVVRTLGDRDTF